MTYATAAALRTALEQRLLNQSDGSGIGIDRLRRRVVFERIVVRLDATEPGQWVLKGGMALEVRLHDGARVTKDIDLGLRDDIDDLAELQDRVVDALNTDLDGDRFQFRISNPRVLAFDGGGHRTWRVTIESRLAGRPFGTLRLDVSPRAHELTATERLALPNSLHFAGIPDRTIETIDVNRHAAEKLHAISRDHGERENSRVRDLVDLVLLVEHGLLDTELLATHARQVWSERNQDQLPAEPPALPDSWALRYADLARQHGLPADIAAATHLLEVLWPARND